MQTAMFWPDTHVGYRNTAVGQEPLHDPQAVRKALKILKDTKPDETILLGDFLDLAPWSLKWQTGKDLKYTTEDALKTAKDYLADIVALSKRVTYLEGNHEARIHKAILDRLPEAEGLLDIPTMLDLRSLGIEYVSPYPRGGWLWESVYVHHGVLARKWGGNTVAGSLQAGGDHHEVFGHIHRVELAGRTQKTFKGVRTVWSMAAGCLCRIDGVVPPGGVFDWQQGVGLAKRHEDGRVELTPVPF